VKHGRQGRTEEIYIREGTIVDEKSFSGEILIFALCAEFFSNWAFLPFMDQHLIGCIT
jgi:hypothetical protein